MKWKVLLSRWSLRLPTLLLLLTSCTTTPTLIRWACHKRELALSPSYYPSSSVRFSFFFFFYDTMAPPLRGWWPLPPIPPFFIPPVSPPHSLFSITKKQQRRNERRRDKKKKNPSWGESITLYKFDDENEPDAHTQQQHTAAAQMGIYIDILCSNITLSISLFFFFAPESPIYSRRARALVCIF
jgi:hypothetical protein